MTVPPIPALEGGALAQSMGVWQQTRLERQEMRRLIAATTAKMMPDARAMDAPEGRLP